MLRTTWPILCTVALCVAVRSPVVAGGSGEYSVREYGARGDGKTMDRAAIQRAIDACASAGGGIVRFSSGVYRSGALRLSSHVVIQLDPGATLQGSPRLEDYYLGKRLVGLILAEDCDGAGIMGSGTIDGSASSFMEMDRKVEADGPLWPRPRPGNTVVFAGCRNFFVRDVTLQNSPFWTLHANGCDNGAITGITVSNDMRVPNNDGIHLTTSRNVRITGCHIRTGDDAIVVTGITDHGPIIPGFVGYRGVSENIVATNCTLASRSCGVRVGYGENDVRGCIFSNLVITDSNRGLGVFVRNKGSVSNILFFNVAITTRLHSARWWGNGEPIHVSAVPLPNEPKIGRIRNIRFSNVLARSESGIVMYGSKESVPSQIHMDHIRLEISAGTLSERSGGIFDLRPALQGKDGGILPHRLAGCDLYRVDGVRINDLQVQWLPPSADYFGSALRAEEFHGLEVDAFRGRPAGRDSTDTGIELRGGRDAILRNCLADDAADVSVAHSGLTGRLILGGDLSKPAPR
jgi:hypothetical protein